jgi:indolepyruvate ferredoxin oxidoreductase
VNITYKILYNDAVAMTGGQPVDGQSDRRRDRPAGARRRASNGSRSSDEPEKYAGHATFPAAHDHHRDDLDAVQRELQTVPGVSVLLYEQTCAAEKRRRRKRGTIPRPESA